MINVFVVGVSGKMGVNILDCALGSDIVVTGGLDAVKSSRVPTFSRAADVDVPIDVIIDFSRPETLDEIVKLAERYSCPVVLATTGYSDEQMAKIKALSEKCGVLHSGNMSFGVNLLTGLVKKVAGILGDFDVEIVEKHHNKKVDAPSGTALMLAKAAANKDSKIVCGRSGASCKRSSEEISISSVRGGTIVGEHDVMFIGDDEIITLSHSALSRKIFANGALKAARFMLGKKSGMYDMNDVLGL